MDAQRKIEELEKTIKNQRLKMNELSQQLEQMAQDLQTKQLYLNSILNQLQTDFCWVDKDLKILLCNQNFLKKFYSDKTESLIERNLSELFQNLDWDKQQLKNLYHSTLDVIQTGKTKRFEIELIKNKKLSIFSFSLMPFYDQTNTIKGALVLSNDITEQKEIERQMLLSNEHISSENLKYSIYLDNILANVPEILYWMDKNEVVLGCNDRQAHSFGLKDKKEVIGKSIPELAKIVGWDQSLVDNLHANNQQVIQSGKGIVIEEKAIFYGQPKIFLSYKNPLFNKDKEVIGVFGISVDITERKKLENELLKAKEDAESANRAKSEFLMNMSHDLRTPLNGILGFSQILWSQERDPIKKEHLDLLLTSAKHLFTLFNELIELSYIEQHLEIKKTYFDIRESLKELYELFQAEVNKKDIRLEIDITQNVPNIISTDKMRLNRIILNLLGNAIKFTSKGKVTIQVNFNNEVLVIKITDTGIGIPEEKLEVIFDKFTRLTSSHHEIYKGFGIGLHLVKKFIDELAGTIHVESKINHGSCFTCSIPL